MDLINATSTQIDIEKALPRLEEPSSPLGSQPTWRSKDETLDSRSSRKFVIEEDESDEESGMQTLPCIYYLTDIVSAIAPEATAWIDRLRRALLPKFLHKQYFKSIVRNRE